ncbi:acireductone dioxygenase apoprotein [Halopseudomonas xinjiangensis]|uniref:Acireductone dioxygenase apoprotein n=2 Tax=Halopseudomonas xinjiangensis TaxID=487184 RepID=A0A1H1PR89_9GAMM|nr:acireductone dioxygenase apoprotein [Halopseudomonas xinjiangensis]
MFLAVYDLDNLFYPTKVLTHRDDINAALASSSIACERHESFAALDPSVLESDAGLLAASSEYRTGPSTCSSVLCLAGLPAYVNPSDVVVEPEQRCADAVRWLFVRGTGQLAVTSQDSLLVMECSAGDLVALPSQARHWFRPDPGQSCVILTIAQSAEGLVRRPSGGDLASRFPGFGL